MSSETSFPERSQTDPRDREPDGQARAYVCAEATCGWQGRDPLAHHRATGHPIKLRNQPASWPDQVFLCCPSGACIRRAKGAA